MLSLSKLCSRAVITTDSKNPMQLDWLLLGLELKCGPSKLGNLAIWQALHNAQCGKFLKDRKSLGTKVAQHCTCIIFCLFLFLVLY